MGNTEQPRVDFQRAIISEVSKVTHIAPKDENGKIIGVKAKHPGIIYYDIKPQGLCTGITNALYTTTTKVYPDRPKIDNETCIKAQAEAVNGGLDYIRDYRHNNAIKVVTS